MVKNKQTNTLLGKVNISSIFLWPIYLRGVVKIFGKFPKAFKLEQILVSDLTIHSALYTQPLGGDSEIVGGNSKNITNIKQKITNI